MSDARIRLLIVEDEADIRRFLRLALENEGFETYEADTVKRALIEAGTRRPELVVLDLGLPDGDGVDFIRDLRAWSACALIVLSARSEETDKIAALDAGADDYLVKPFNLDELVARVFALRRRSQGWASSELRLGALCVNSRQRQVKLAGEEIHLSDREFRLLVALIEMPGSVLSVAQLEERLYGWGEEIASNSIEVQLHRLRRKLGKEWIRNVRGIGFKLVDPAA